jgi:hypothetical protein
MCLDPSLSQGFSQPGVHSLVYKDDFCSFASGVRQELLSYPHWAEMVQEGQGGVRKISPHRQNGITAGHLSEADHGRLPLCWKFKEFLTQNLGVLCPLMGIDPADAVYVETNAMAYGGGAWLSPHTDCLTTASSQKRLAAWMLYLTAPEDGEWPAEKGGAVRVWTPGQEEQRVRPRFNRFAMFRVHEGSLHEVEKIAWDPAWPNCRLALSGWIQGRPQPQFPRASRIYMQSESAPEKREEIEQSLQGELAFLRILEKQKSYCGLDTRSTVEQISNLEQDYEAHREAPPGTSFLRRVPGPPRCIFVVNDAGDRLYFGSLDGYLKKLQSGGESPAPPLP